MSIRPRRPAEPATASPRTDPDFKKVQVICVAFVFVIALAFYVGTLAPTVTFVDSGELIVAAKNLGVAHPPGTPLYVLLAHLFTLLPVGNVALRVNFASALFAALATATTCLLVIEILQRTAHKYTSDRKRTARANQSTAGEHPIKPPHPAKGLDPGRLAAEFVPGLIAALFLTFSRTLWSFATVAEVYTLNSLLIVVILLLLFHWVRSGAMRLLYSAAFIFGLALGVHHVTVALMLPALAVVVLRSEGLGFFGSKRLIYAALISCAGLFLVYSYLPIAAARSPIMNWGDPRTLQRIWWHISGRQYQAFLSFSVDEMAHQAAAFGRLVAREFGPPWLPLGLALALAGLVDSFRRDRTIFYFLTLVIVADLVFGLNYEIAEDKGAYYLPAFVAVAIAAGLGGRWLITLAEKHEWHGGALLSILLAMLAAVLPLTGNFAISDRHQYFLANDYVQNIESTMAPRGMLLTGDWQTYSPFLYFREIESRRRDIIAIDVHLLRRSWYFDLLEKQYPELINQNRVEVRSFLDDLRAWENDPARYAGNAALTERINSRFYQLIEAFIRKQSTPVYATRDVAMGAGEDAQLAQWMRTNYQLVPQGLVFQLAKSGGFVESANVSLITRGLADNTVRFDSDDVVTQKVLPTYVNMLYNRGVYLSAYGRSADAMASFQEALLLDANDSRVRQALTDIEKTGK